MPTIPGPQNAKRYQRVPALNIIIFLRRSLKPFIFSVLYVRAIAARTGPKLATYVAGLVNPILIIPRFRRTKATVKNHKNE